MSRNTHFAPQPDYVTPLNTQTYHKFFEKNAARSVFMMYYIPSYKTAQLTLVQFYRAALAFHVHLL